MKGFADNIEKRTEENNNFREVLYTGQNIQLVLMALKPGESRRRGDRSSRGATQCH